MAGFTWGVYSSDDGHDYLIKVDLDLYVMPERGWSPPEPERPPHVVTAGNAAHTAR